MRGAIPAALSLLGLTGLTISLYLTVTHWGGQPIACAGVGDCNYVNGSVYADVAGVPVSALGALLYASLAGTALAWWWRDDMRLQVLHWGFALTGFGYAAYLTYVEIYVLEAICVWCMTSAAILTASLALSTVGLMRAPVHDEVSTRPESTAAS